MTEGSVFSCLPIAVRDSLLQQAFQQLDQRHLLGVAPMVCRLWHQLSLSMLTSLEIRICTEEVAKQLSLWMTNHGNSLQRLTLHMGEHICRCTSKLQTLMQSVGAADQLRSLNIYTPEECWPLLDLSLTMLAKLTILTSLCISGCNLTRGGTLRQSILCATTLRNLSLTSWRGAKWGSLVQQISTSLVQLTHLELGGISAGAADINHICALPQLQQLHFREYVYATELSKLGPLPISTIMIAVPDGAEAEVGRWLEQSTATLQELVFCAPPYPYGTFVGILPLIPLQHAPLLRNLTMLGITQPNLTHLAALTQLTALQLRGCGIDDAGMLRLAGLSELQSLNVLNNKGILGVGGSMEVLAESMPHLTALYVNEIPAGEAARHAFGPEKVKSY